MTLNFDKLITFTANWYKQVGTFVIKWIREDTKAGKFQNEEQNLPYISERYKKLKANDMRYTSSTQFQFGKNAKKKTKKESRIPQYKGKRIASNNISFVDMTLTGDMLRGMHVKEASNNKVVVAFRTQDYWKLKGNEDYGRVLNGLRKQNRDKLIKLVVERINQNIKSQLNSQKWETEIKM